MNKSNIARLIKIHLVCLAGALLLTPLVAWGLSNIANSIEAVFLIMFVLHAVLIACAVTLWPVPLKYIVQAVENDEKETFWHLFCFHLVNVIKKRLFKNNIFSTDEYQAIYDEFKKERGYDDSGD